MKKSLVKIAVVLAMSLVISALIFRDAQIKKNQSFEQAYDKKVSTLENCLNGADQRYSFMTDTWFENHPGQKMPGNVYLYYMETLEKERKNCYSTFSD